MPAMQEGPHRLRADVEVPQRTPHRPNPVSEVRIGLSGPSVRGPVHFMTQCRECREEILMPVSHSTDRRGKVTMIITTSALRDHLCAT